MQIKKISKENFSNYGELISINNNEPENAQTPQFHFDLARIEVLGNNSDARLNIIKTTKKNFPLKIDMMEMHPFSSQVFLPMSETDFIVLVAPIDKKPDLDKIEVFKISKGDGINIKSSIWHFPLISTQNAQFITIDKKDAKTNIEIYNFIESEKFILNHD